MNMNQTRLDDRFNGLLVAAALACIGLFSFAALPAADDTSAAQAVASVTLDRKSVV